MGILFCAAASNPIMIQYVVSDCEEALQKAGLSAGLVVDCSHANSNKDYRRQPLVAENVVHQILDGNQSIIGIMLESHLNAGNQSSDNKTLQELEYGVSHHRCLY